MKRFFSALLAGAIVLTSMPAALAVDDTSGHWAKNYINYMSQLDIMRPSSDGSYKPDQTVMRAEFMRYMNRAFHFTEKAEVRFDDVQQYDSTGAQVWYYEPIQIAVKHGYINGVGQNKMDPTGNVTREQAATIIGRLHKYLPTSDSTQLTFTDKSKIGDWSMDYIAESVGKGYLSGYPDGTFRPTGNITRAELAKLLYQFMGTAFETKGASYTETGLRSDTNNVTISEPCTLSNTKIKGNLYITEGVLDGQVTLDNVTVEGNIIVSGGVVQMEDTTTEKMIVSSPVGRLLQVTASGDTNIGTTEIQTNATLCEDNLGQGAGGFSDLVLTGDKKPALTLEGAVWDVTTEGQCTINTTSTTTINALIANAVTTVTGYGTLRKAKLNVKDCSIAMEPASVELASGVTAMIAGESTVSKNQVGVTPSSVNYDLASDTSLYLEFQFEHSSALSKLYYDNTALTENSDYRITDEGIRLYSSWLKTLKVGAYTLTLKFEDGTTGEIAVKVNNSSESALETTSATFDKNVVSDKYANIPVVISLASGTVLDAVRISGKTLTRGDDYTYNASTNTAILQKEYLAKMSTGSYSVTFKLSKGNDLRFTLYMEDSSPKNELSTTAIDFDANTSSGGYTDVTVSLSAANDATLSKITCGNKTLELDWQYRLNGDQVIISKTAISSLIDKSQEYLDLTFDMSNGIDPVLRIHLVTTYPIEVNVVDDLGVGLEGVTVTVTPTTTDNSLSAAQTLTTGVSGKATGYVKRGTYAVTASGGNLKESMSRTISLNTNKQIVTFTATIEQTANIYIVSENGAAIEGATVTLGGQSVTTTASGLATFQIARGSYTARVTCTGYNTENQTIIVTGNITERIKLDKA